MTTVNFEVPNIGCAGCVQAIKNELTELAGVSSVAGDVETRVVQIEFEPPASQDLIIATLTEIDYPPASN